MSKFDLQPGETVLWQGRPEAFRTLDRCVTPTLLKDLLVSLIGGALIVAEYWFCSGKAALRPTILWIPALLLCVPIIHLILDVIRLQRTEYYVTDRRLAVVGHDVRDVEYSRIREAALRKDRAGHTSLLCGGKALAAGDASYRERTVVGLDALIGDDTVCDSFAFYAVDQPESLKASLAGVLPLA